MGRTKFGPERGPWENKSYWNKKPALTGTTMTGFGDFKLFDQPQLEKPQI
jgi:hypothetical protein